MRFLDPYEEIMRDATLFDERNFTRRFEAIELLELVALTGAASSETVGQESAPEPIERLMAALGAVDERLFVRLRAEIAVGRHRGEAFEKLLLDHCVVEDGPGYDALDVFTNRLCSFLPMPVPTRKLEAEMVDFHKTPARVVLELARRVTSGDVFVDLGAGLGQVVLLVHLLTGARVRGLEIEPVFCVYARRCMVELGLSGPGLPGAAEAGGVAGAEAGEVGGAGAVAFLEGDARFANYSEGSVFFMYTPFRGELLETVFGLLRQEATTRSLMLITYGPCTIHAARQGWLRADGPLPDGGDGLGIFIATGGTCG